jgi:hypothetical protein
MARATEPHLPRNLFNIEIGAPQEQVPRCRHTPFQNVPVGWHTQTPAECAFEVTHANTRQAGKLVQCDRIPEVFLDVILDNL